MVEGARLESACTVYPYLGFESLLLRQDEMAEKTLAQKVRACGHSPKVSKKGAANGLAQLTLSVAQESAVYIAIRRTV